MLDKTALFALNNQMFTNFQKQRDHSILINHLYHFKLDQSDESKSQERMFRVKQQG